jgi:hypothetical protein
MDGGDGWTGGGWMEWMDDYYLGMGKESRAPRLANESIDRSINHSLLLLSIPPTHPHSNETTTHQPPLPSLLPASPSTTQTNPNPTEPTQNNIYIRYIYYIYTQVTLPSIAPSGNYDIKITAMDQDHVPLICIEAQLSL